MAPDDRTLHYFRVVYATGSIRAAARELGLAPSAISRKIAQLERQLGTPVLERSARGIRATEAGRILARFADDRTHLDESLAEQLDELRQLRRGRVRLASGEGFVDDLVTHGVASFLRDHPGISVELVIGGTDEIVDMLLTDDVELALALHARPDPELEILGEAPQPLHVVCTPNHPLSGRDAVTPDELNGAPATVLPGRFGLRTLTDQLQRAHGITFDVRLVSGSIQAMVAFVLAGLGVTLLPHVAVAPYLRAGRLAAIPLDAYEPGSVRAQLLRRRGRTLSHAATRLADHCVLRLESLESVASTATQ